MSERIRNIGKEYMSSPLRTEERRIEPKDIEAGKQASKGKERKGLKKLITTGLGILATLAAIQSGARRAAAKGTETNVKGGVITESGEVPEWDAPISFDQELTIKTENKEQQGESLEVSTLPQFAISDYEKARLKDNQGFTPDLDSPLGKNAKRLEALGLPKDAVGIYTAFSPDMQNATNFLYFKGEVLVKDKDGREEKFPKGAIMYLDMQGGLHYLVPGEGKKAIISIVDENLQNFFGSLSFKDGRKITVPNLGEFVLLEVNGNGVITLFITNHEPINVGNPESSGLQGTPTPPATEEAPKAQDINVGARAETGLKSMEEYGVDINDYEVIKYAFKNTPAEVKNTEGVNAPDKDHLFFWRIEDNRTETWHPGMTPNNKDLEAGWLVVTDEVLLNFDPQKKKENITKIVFRMNPEKMTERAKGKEKYSELELYQQMNAEVIKWLQRNSSAMEKEGGQGIKAFFGKEVLINVVAADYKPDEESQDFVMAVQKVGNIQSEFDWKPYSSVGGEKIGNKTYNMRVQGTVSENISNPAKERNAALSSLELSVRIALYEVAADKIGFGSSMWYVGSPAMKTVDDLAPALKRYKALLVPKG